MFLECFLAIAVMTPLNAAMFIQTLVSLVQFVYLQGQLTSSRFIEN